MTLLKSFEKLIAEAESAPFSGWDFLWLKGRFVGGSPPWNFQEKVRSAMENITTLLNMGTGGGEVPSLQPLPVNTYATESWLPNLKVATRRLRPLGVKVVQVEFENQLSFDFTRENQANGQAESNKRLVLRESHETNAGLASIVNS